MNPQIEPYPLFLLVRSEQTDRLAREAMREKLGKRVDLFIPVDNEMRFFRVILSPIDRNGLVVLFHDLTNEWKNERMRAEFVANVSHELKTPLTAIRGFVETLKAHPEMEEARKNRFLGIIEKEAFRLERLINDTLDLSKIENSSRDVRSVRFDLDALIREVLLSLNVLADAKHVRLDYHPRPGSGGFDVLADPDRIRQALLNLCENAIKYNHDGGFVSVAVKDDPEAGVVRIDVEDDGPGIDAKDIGRIFERFYRSDKSRSRALGGTGLGLSIVKHIAKLYEGDVRYERRADQGSRFIFRTKILPPQPAPSSLFGPRSGDEALY